MPPQLYPENKFISLFHFLLMWKTKYKFRIWIEWKQIFKNMNKFLIFTFSEKEIETKRISVVTLLFIIIEI